MKYGVLVYNLIHERDDRWTVQVESWVTAFRKVGIKLIPVSNAQAVNYISQNKKFFKFCLFWDKDIYVAKAIEDLDIPVFNRPRTIEICDDKALTYLTFKKHNIATPKTVVLPFIYQRNIGEYLTLIKQLTNDEGIRFPFVVKERKGSFGEQVYLVKSEKEFFNLLRTIGEKPLIIQEFIKVSAGKDFRVCVVGKKVVAVVERINDTGDFRSNVNSGGQMYAVRKPNKKIVKLALDAAKAVKADYCGVDIVLNDHGLPLVLEVNSNARTLSAEAASGKYITLAFAKYVKEKYKFRNYEN